MIKQVLNFSKHSVKMSDQQELPGWNEPQENEQPIAEMQKLRERFNQETLKLADQAFGQKHAECKTRIELATTTNRELISMVQKV